MRNNHPTRDKLSLNCLDEEDQMKVGFLFYHFQHSYSLQTHNSSIAHYCSYCHKSIELKSLKQLFSLPQL